jgi:hypothetical protein
MFHLLKPHVLVASINKNSSGSIEMPNEDVLIDIGNFFNPSYLYSYLGTFLLKPDNAPKS